MSESTQLHKQIQNTYTRRLNQSEGCCGGSSCGGDGVLTHLAEYPAEQTRRLPAEARDHSFGCGNPLAFEGVQSGQTVLDVGSGAGLDALLAASRVGPEGRVIGVDMTPAMIEQARRAAAVAGAENVEFRLGQAEALPAADSSVDWLISNCVINLAPDKTPVFAEIFRVLKPGGRISVSDIILQAPLPEILVGNAEFWAACVGGAITESDYVGGLEEAGLVDVTVSDRLVYDSRVAADMLAASSTDLPSGLAADLDGVVASVRFEARKP